MSIPYSTTPPTNRWIPALVMLTGALLLVAWLLNGVGRVGLMAPASGGGVLTEAVPPAHSEQLPFAGVDRAIERLRPEDDGRPDQFDAYEPVLLALAEAMPEQPDARSLARARTLLSGSLPDPAVADLMQMLPGFLAYHRAEQSFLGLTPGGPRSTEGAYVHQKLQQALRRTALGEEVADRLYHTSQRMIDIHLVRQLVIEREDLDQSEKQQLIRRQMEALADPHPDGDAG